MEIDGTRPISAVNSRNLDFLLAIRTRFRYSCTVLGGTGRALSAFVGAPGLISEGPHDRGRGKSKSNNLENAHGSQTTSIPIASRTETLRGRKLRRMRSSSL